MAPDVLLERVERAILASGLTPTAFGRAAANDPMLVFEMRRGRELRSRTAQAVLDFIEDMPKPKRRRAA
jgi:hypothetical protein